MIKKVQVGTKIMLSSRCEGYRNLQDKVYEIQEVIDGGASFDGIMINIDDSEDIINFGGLLKKDFDYYGMHVNNEIIDLVSKHDIKSFQAVLDDGRIINYNCLN